MNPFEVLVHNLNALGFFGFLLPWVFIFVVAFGLLAKTKALGDDMRIAAVASIVLGFFVVGFGGPWLASFFVNVFGLGAAVLAGLLVLVLFMGMTGMGLDQLAKNKAVLAVLIGIAVIVFAIAAGALSAVVNQTTIAIVLVLIVMAVAVVFIAGK
ncbi:MAG: hypothetical protein QXF55_02755 [Candidatus Aenigmatarchaeota archaeon]